MLCQPRGAPRLCRGAPERWGVWGAMSGPPTTNSERAARGPRRNAPAGLHAGRRVDRRRRRGRPLRTIGSRQDADAPVPGRSPAPERRPHRGGWPHPVRFHRRRRRAAAGASRRLRLPGLRAVSAYERGRERRLRSAPAPAGGARRAHGAGARSPRPRRSCRTSAARALRRPAAARGAGPGARHRSRAAPPRRAAVGTGRAAAPRASRRAPRDPPRLAHGRRRGHPRLHRCLPAGRPHRGIRRRARRAVGAALRAPLAAGVGVGGADRRHPERAAGHGGEGDARPHPAALARPAARGGQLAEPLVPAGPGQSHRVLRAAGVRPPDPQGPRPRRPQPPHEPHGRHRRRRRGFRNDVESAHPARRARDAGAGRLRRRGGGATPGLRDPRDRPRPALAVLDPPRLDPRAAGVTPSTVLALRDVRRRYGARDALDVRALDVVAGEVLAVIGPNGAGKSTLLRVLGLLERPDTGQVLVRGRAVDGREALGERRRMATVFQEPLLTDATVADNVALGLRFRGVSAAAGRARVARWLERLGVGGLATRAARTLPGGEAQRIALARALVLEPEVLLLDEPFAGLDAPARAALMTDLGAILRADRTTTVLVTHERGEALALADRVAVLMAGRLRQVDATARVFYAPVAADVARFVGVETLVTGRVLQSDGGVTAVDTGGRVVEVAADARPGATVRLAIRPEDVTLEPAGMHSRSSARNALEGVIAGIAASTHAIHVTVDVGFPLVAAVTARSAKELGLAPGTRVCAVFKASAAHLIAREGGA